jgi:nitrogenase molybdenum-iron protein NifN
VGYRGTRNFVYEVGNLLMEQISRTTARRLAAAGRVARGGLQRPAGGPRDLAAERKTPPAQRLTPASA